MGFNDGQDHDAQGRALCMCGCGKLAPISPDNRARKGYVKGQPRRYVAGHGPRVLKHKLPPPNPGGRCLCGCGGITPICKNTNAKRGNVLGEHVRFMYGHNNHRPTKATRA